jgi:hypothetical protein
LTFRASATICMFTICSNRALMEHAHEPDSNPSLCA